MNMRSSIVTELLNFLGISVLVCVSLAVALGGIVLLISSAN